MKTRGVSSLISPHPAWFSSLLQGGRSRRNPHLRDGDQVRKVRDATRVGGGRGDEIVGSGAWAGSPVIGNMIPVAEIGVEERDARRPIGIFRVDEDDVRI